MTSNTDLRDIATGEGINRTGYSTQALEVRNERKRPNTVAETTTVTE